MDADVHDRLPALHVAAVRRRGCRARPAGRRASSARLGPQPGEHVDHLVGGRGDALARGVLDGVGDADPDLQQAVVADGQRARAPEGSPMMTASAL